MAVSQKSKARVTAFSAVYKPVEQMLDASSRKAGKQAELRNWEKQVKQLVAPYKAKGLKLKQDTYWTADWYAAVSRAALRAEADLVIKSTFLMGNWTRIHIDEAMTPAQQETFDRMFPVIFAGFDRLARSRHRVPFAVERGDGTLRFSVPESSVDMALLPGLSGERIEVNGLPNPAYHEYVQYRAVDHRHSSADATWEYVGTNGFTSVMRVSG